MQIQVRCGPHGAMAGRQPTRAELDAALVEATDRLSAYGKKIALLIQKVEDLERDNESLKRRLAYYDNPNTPPSAKSIEYMEQKRREREARESGEAPPRKKSGGKEGHAGASRRHKPSSTVCHKAKRSPCGCGGKMRRSRTVTRDIIDFERPAVSETRHVIEVLECGRCGKETEAECGLPERGSYGKNTVATVASLRASRMTIDAIARHMQDVVGIYMSNSTVVNVLANACDAMEVPAGAIKEEVFKSEYAHMDETSNNFNGKKIWTWGFASKNAVVVVNHRSRGSCVLDELLDGYGGCMVHDGFAVYKSVGGKEMHQRCWAHELRAAKQPAYALGGDFRRIYADLCALYADAEAARGAASAEKRRSFEYSMDAMLDRYRGSEDPRMVSLVGRLESATPDLFTFLEYPFLPSTNNAAERMLRDPVVRRKISGQIKGPRWVRRMSVFLTCVLTWRMRGKNVYDEVWALV